ncbi:MFS general substrate transporter [Sparassis crispa]|uniref:MFS general substrate transporter n=1 Tax=Sparassis crispa TaxID=139825 RepID=A0A401GL76_9APHY|nr:MFS general substrate transporter [Sparassis crispa]GBE82904.1 MFS general substrate transporter [Sparassis crispa]
MESEETSLLDPQSSVDVIVLEHEKVYLRFSPRQKRVVVAVVSWAGLIPLFVSGSFVPSIPQIARELHSTGPVISLAVSLAMLSGAISSLIWATYSGHYGRRPVFLASLPCLCAGSLGVGTATSIRSLMVWRVVQAFGASSGLSVGAGVIGDIYKLEERGTAMGIFFGATQLGVALAPVVGGIATHYASWRVTQYALFFAGVLALILTAVYLPETSHPGARGVDKSAEDEPEGWRWVWLNPFASIALLRSPNLFAITLAATFVLLTDFVLLVPLPYTIAARYNITNEALIGAFFMAAGCGNVMGAPIAGRISDKIVVKWRTRRGGRWVPEDRLRATVLPALVLVPCSILFSGLTTRFVAGRVGIALNLVCLFMNGIGVDLVLSPLAAYMVDVMHSRSAELIAAHKGTRNLIVGAVTSGVLPLINLIGVAATDGIAAVLAWAGFVLLWATIRYGEKMRAWLDVGYSTMRDN